MRRLSAVALLLAGSLVAAPEASAQLAVSVAAGAALPMGDGGEGLKMGYNATVGVGIKPPLAPLGFRVEGMYNSFEIEDVTDGSVTTMALVANGTFNPVPAAPFYLIGGLGMYSSKAKVGSISGDSESDIGINVGAGFNIPLTGFGTFIEARYHHIMSDPSFGILPITVGIKF
jgi:hypothetical protein